MKAKRKQTRREIDLEKKLHRTYEEIAQLRRELRQPVPSTVRVILPRVDGEEGILATAIRGISDRLAAVEHDILLTTPHGHVARDHAQAKKLFGGRVSGFSDTPSTLRRRARHLEQMGYEAEFVKVIRDAAEEIVVRRRAATDDAQTAVDAVVDNRRLRGAMEQTFRLIMGLQSLGRADRDLVLRPLGLAIRAVRQPGVGRRILALDIGQNATREFIELRVRELLDAHFNQPQPGEPHGEENLEDEEGRRDAQEAEEPTSAGPDADQPAAPAGARDEARSGDEEGEVADHAERSAVQPAAERPAPGWPKAGAAGVPAGQDARGSADEEVGKQ